MSEPSTTELLMLRNRVVSGEADEVERADFADVVSKLDHRPSIELLRKLLRDEDDIVLYEALNALVLRMGVRDSQMEVECRRLFSEDPDNDVRRMALACLGSIYFDSYDLEFFLWVRRRLEEQRFEPEQVATATRLLYEIPGRHAREWPDRMGARAPMTYDEIDWDKVAELEAEVRAGKQNRSDR